jgi:DNA modification methylase
VEGAAHTFLGGHSQTSLWEVDKPHRSEFHPTMKPVELFAKAIGNSCEPGGIVADPFLGSGTTMVAAEQLGRVCYGMEIEPKYVAVTLQRMADMGLEPRLIGQEQDNG